MSSILDVDDNDDLFEVLINAYIKRIKNTCRYPPGYNISYFYDGVIGDFKTSEDLMVCRTVSYFYNDDQNTRTEIHFCLVSIHDHRYRKSQFGDHRGKPFHCDYHGGQPVTLDYITNHILNK